MRYFFLFYSLLTLQLSFCQTIKNSNGIDQKLKQIDLLIGQDRIDSAIVFSEEILQHNKPIQQVKNNKLAKEEVVRNWKELEQMAVEYNLQNLQSLSFYLQGESYFTADQNRQAMNAFLQVDSLFKLQTIAPRVFLNSKNRIVELLFKASNYNDTAYFSQIERHLNEALIVCDEYPTIVAPAASLNLHMAVLQKFRNKLTEAKSFYHKAISLSSSLQDHKTLAIIYSDIGNMYAYNTAKLDSAEYYFLKAIDENQFHTDTLNIAHINIQVASFYNYLEQPNQAKKYINVAKRLRKKVPEPRKESQFKLKDVETNIYYSLGMLDSAYYSSKEANRILVTMYEEKNRDNVAELEAVYDTKNKTNEIQLLKAQNELVENRKRNQRNWFLAGLVVALILLMLLYQLYLSRQKANLKLKELDQFKSQLFTNISHDLRTPLTLIAGNIEQQMQDPSVLGRQKEKLSLIQNSSNQLIKLVEQITAIAKLESNQLSLRVSRANLLANVIQEISAFEYIAKKQKLTIHHQINLPTIAWFDVDVLQKIITNLLSNSVKYASKESVIIVQSTHNDNQLCIVVQNKVDQIQKLQNNRLFERFYQLDNRADGMGIGLSLVKQFVELHKGTIEFTTVKDNTVEFTVQLPVGKSYFSADEIVELADEPEFTMLNEENQEQETDELPILLLVEDDADIRHLLRSVFQQTFQIIEASDGEIGIKKAVERIPDLIISDIMMPNADGLTLLKTVKNDERTSHIPILLLTAKVGDKNVVEGITSGADDYIEKPFKVAILKAKANRLISVRKELQQKFSKELFLHPLEIAIPSTEEKFVTKLTSVLNSKLIDSTLTVEEFSDCMNMGRMQLHRKLKALTGKSTSAFIRANRLKLAANLLRTQNDAQISEIGYYVGFNDISYFNKCFKLQFGCTPSEYVSKDHS